METEEHVQRSLNLGWHLAPPSFAIGEPYGSARASNQRWL